MLMLQVCATHGWVLSKQFFKQGSPLLQISLNIVPEIDKKLSKMGPVFGQNSS